MKISKLLSALFVLFLVCSGGYYAIKENYDKANFFLLLAMLNVIMDGFSAKRRN